MLKNKALYLFLTLILLVSTLPLAGLAKEQEEPDVDLWNVVKPLGTTVTFLNTGAHPDDERSDFLAYLSRGLGVKTASLIANRGEGGQNEIGTELGNGLGIIRSNEMIEAAKITNVKAYHLSETTSDAIYDFGFSKSPDETLEFWDEEVTYERFIRFIRTYQPDIVMPSFRDVDSQHGHHRAITILSLRAYEDAADPSVFPEHLEEGLSVWQTKKLYLPAESPQSADLSIEIGNFDPIYGMSYPQIGEESRYMHKSQGMGRDIPVEPRQTHLELVNQINPSGQDDELFAGIPYDFNEWAEIIPARNVQVQLEKLQQQLDKIIDLYPNREAILPVSQKALKDVERIQKLVGKAKINEELKNDLLHKLEIKEEQLQEVSFVTSSLTVKTDVDSYVLTQGQQGKVTMTVSNEGNETIKHVKASLALPADWQQVKAQNIGHLKSNESKTVTFNITAPEDASYYEPYGEPVVQGVIEFKEQGTTVSKLMDLDNTVAVLPELSVTPNPKNVTINTANVQENIPINVVVKNYYKGENDGIVSLDLPEGWTSSPEQIEVAFTEQFEETEVTFLVTPPSDIEDGDFSFDAIAESNGNLFNTTVQEISYDHIKDSYYLSPSTVNTIAFELLTEENLKIGYIESGFDQIADYLINAGLDVDKLTEEDLSTGDLSQYDTIVTGIRAYLSREDLVNNNDRLLEYVENGGHFVVQYHKPNDNWDTNTTAPYALKIGTPSIRWRVTDETADVSVLQPEHKLFNYPNNITDSDWDNWVQERGLYFPMEWDDRYETFVSMADPNEDPFTSGILLAEYGEGTYMYTNLVFYRQMDSQVPGAYRIFTNLISYSKE